MHMTRAGIVLGRVWLHGLCSSLTHSYQHNTLTFDAHGAHVLLMGEQDALVYPMICNADLHAIIDNNEINSFSLFYLMPPSLEPIVFESEVSKAKGFYATSSCTSFIKHTPIKQH